jgi:hypothetical protein
MKTVTTGRIWVEHPDNGKRSDASFEEHRGFWTWAMVEVLRHTGILLRPDPAERGRLTQIRDNLLDRITEAETNRWFGEAEGLKVSLAGARDKLAQMGQITARRDTAINLGLPTFTEAAGRTSSTGPRTDQIL